MSRRHLIGFKDNDHCVEGVHVSKSPSYILTADLQLGLVYDSKMENVVP